MIQFLTLGYTLGFLALALFGLKMLLLVALYWRTRRGAVQPSSALTCPPVTVQIPLFNERLVAARVIDAVCSLRWPATQLEIQVLDDSDDATRAIVDARVESWRARGVDVQVLRRPRRSGYKAGALAYGAGRARGELLAIFDADFLPQPDFLEKTVPFLAPDVAVVQARWGHLNPDLNWLTRLQALALDGHFVVEQTARARNGLMINFNGTAGVWRRDAIAAAGGWQDDTLAEDVDLSYRAQLAGWRLVYLPDVVAPAELPPTLLGFKRQQRRWAKGTTQLLRKLSGSIWRSQLPLAVRLHGLFSLGEHLLQPLTLALALGLPLVIVYRPALPAALVALWLLALGPPLLFGLAASSLYRDWPARMLYYPVLAILSLGLAVNGTVAVIEGLVGSTGPFERTPKVGDASGQANARERLWLSGYGLRPDPQVLAEVSMALYSWLGVSLAIWRSVPGWLPFQFLFALGFSLSAAVSLWEGSAARPRLRRLQGRSRDRAPV